MKVKRTAPTWLKILAILLELGKRAAIYAVIARMFIIIFAGM